MRPVVLGWRAPPRRACRNTEMCGVDGCSEILLLSAIRELMATNETRHHERSGLVVSVQRNDGFLPESR